MPNYTTTTIAQKYHDAIVDWQKRNFPELAILEKHWDDQFKGQPPFQLVAKIGDIKSDIVEVGQYAGRRRSSNGPTASVASKYLRSTRC